MLKRRHWRKKLIAKLREANALLRQGCAAAAVVTAIGIHGATC